VRAHHRVSGRPITDTETHRIAHKEPFFQSAKMKELSAKTLSLAGLSVEQVDRFASAAAAAAAAAVHKGDSGGSRMVMRRQRFLECALDVGEIKAAAAAAAAAMIKSSKTGHEQAADEARDSSRRTSVKWLGRTGAAVVKPAVSTKTHATVQELRLL
jgi:hypothetical protein